MDYILDVLLRRENVMMERKNRPPFGSTQNVEGLQCFSNV